MTTAQPLTPHQERAVSVEAGCDPRTVRKYLAGGKVESTVGSRISRALQTLFVRGDAAVRGEVGDATSNVTERKA